MLRVQSLFVPACSLLTSTILLDSISVRGLVCVCVRLLFILIILPVMLCLFLRVFIKSTILVLCVFLRTHKYYLKLVLTLSYNLSYFKTIPVVSKPETKQKVFESPYTKVYFILCILTLKLYLILFL